MKYIALKVNITKNLKIFTVDMDFLKSKNEGGTMEQLWNIFLIIVRKLPWSLLLHTYFD